MRTECGKLGFIELCAYSRSIVMRIAMGKELEGGGGKLKENGLWQLGVLHATRAFAVFNLGES